MDMDGICKSPKKAAIFLFFLNVIRCAFEVQFSALSVHQARDMNCIQTFPFLPQTFTLPCWKPTL